jgi:RNA polymerase sigma-70 factor (ECF subfamily)
MRRRADTTEGGEGVRAAYLGLYGRLKATLARRVGSLETAEDIVQDAYLRLATREAQGVAAPEAYVWRTVGNLALDHRRNLSRRAATVDPVELERAGDETPGADQRLIDQARLRQVLTIAAELPPRCREVFVLRKLDGVDQAEIARRLGVSRNMVEKHLRHALELITTRLAAEDAA